MNQFQVWVTGNVATPVHHVVSERGFSVADFRLASTPRRHDREQGWLDGQTSFVKVTCFRALADNVASSLEVGQPVVVAGRLQVEESSRDGRVYRDTVVVATAVGPDLSRGTATFRRQPTRRPAADGPGGPPSDAATGPVEPAEQRVGGQAA